MTVLTTHHTTKHNAGKKSLAFALALALFGFTATPVYALKTVEINSPNALSEQQRFELIQDLANHNEWQKVFEIVQEMALEGNSNAQSNLGILYNLGRGVEKNKEKAYWWFSEAAEQGSVKAINNLAVMFYKGSYVKKNVPHAIKLFEKTAAVGNIEAIIMLGEIAISENHDHHAFKWFQKAADLGSPEGTFRLGVLYEIGRGTKRDVSKAVSLYQAVLHQQNVDLLVREQAFNRLLKLENNKN